MKQTPEETIMMDNFLPGKISKDGFLGDDTRHLHDIIAEDDKSLSRLGVSRADIAARLQFLIDEGKKGLESEVRIKGYQIRLQWDRGMIPCPFGDKPLHYKITAEVTRSADQTRLVFSQLSVHLIEKHGFFGGLGSRNRLEPRVVVVFLSDIGSD